MYYIGNTVECKYTVYICESGYQKFSNTRGCGCDKIFKAPTVQANTFQALTTQVNHSQASYSQSNYDGTYTNIYSQRLIQSHVSHFSDKDRAEQVVGNFMNRLYAQGYSDSQIYNVIQKIEKRLDAIRNTSNKQQTMIRYLKAELSDYERRYRDSYDHIYDVFEYHY